MYNVNEKIKMVLTREQAKATTRSILDAIDAHKGDDSKLFLLRSILVELVLAEDKGL